MKREKNKLLSLFCLSLLCFLLGFKLGGFIFGSILIIKGIRYYQDPDRLTYERMSDDSSRWGVSLPEPFILRKRLFKIYKNVLGLEKREPLFIDSIGSVLDEFWHSSTTLHTREQWESHIAYLERNLPVSSAPKHGLERALEDFQNLNFEYEKVTAEVRN